MIFDQKETTSVRGMAILMIAIFHLFIAWEWPRVVNLPRSVGVAAFLFLSGYGIKAYQQNKANVRTQIISD